MKAAAKSRESIGRQLKAAEKAEQAARDKRRELQDRHFAEVELPKMRKQVGKCYKYRNCYSCPQYDADYWWLYIKVIGVDDGAYVILECERAGYRRAKIAERAVGADFTAGSRYIPITPEEFSEAAGDLLADVAFKASKT